MKEKNKQQSKKEVSQKQGKRIVLRKLEDIKTTWIITDPYQMSKK